ncbi:NDP-hexose 2,3-dehydratase family protein [Streptomyces cinnabarinus]|uniref:NDP-hexose 2,3-dehydratase family protein n=1 Tax=Streptomyces cinnabarinus TaxID=67287 RepID=A0ABY7KM20_9ACTN|nr:NDP-hexose 2,3-dehydratase family protein [Streptomyces cinnabarinus]WAZ24635.1 NDP-hexose 2,3-dehydratase family protein [Streptomyces cinnabarinus]
MSAALEDRAAFLEWFDERRAANTYRVTPVPLDALDGWHFDPGTGNLGHRSGGFFTVEGIEASLGEDVGSWTQPIIIQDEIGILGILVKRFGGTPYFLMQAKMEPGNVNTLQLSPTVQATRSNYTRVHRGSAVPYLEYFVDPRQGRRVFDSLQSEQGSWFLAKRNRNMIVEIPEDAEVPAHDSFRWVSQELLKDLLRIDNVVNMDSRTVLSGLPFLHGEQSGTGDEPHTKAEILSWFTEARSNHVLERRRIPLNQVKGWSRGPERIEHERGAFFTVLGVEVEASSREVARWSQPLLAPVDRGVVAFLARRPASDADWQVLVHAQSEAGTSDVVEMSPTVNCVPANYTHLPAQQRPPFLDQVLSAPASRIHFDTVLSEEGGRFHHAENRYLLVEVGDDFPAAGLPDDYIWMTRRQLTGFVRYGNHVNVVARSLLACLMD